MNWRHPICWLLFFLLALGLAQAAGAVEKSVDFGSEVAAGRWTGIRLRNLNAGATLSIVLNTGGALDLMLLNSQSYSAFSRNPNEVAEPLFQSSVTDRIEFSVVSPKTDDYYLIVDNRQGTTPQSFKLQARASLEIPPSPGRIQPPDEKTGGPPASDEAAAAKKRVDEVFARLIANLGKVFKFDPFGIRLVRCHRGNAFASRTEIYLCAEYIKALQAKLQDKNRINDILLFTLMHEISHVLFTQWQYPFNDNEEVVDEFATVLLLLFNQRQTVENQAEFFASIPPEPEQRAELMQDVRHRLSVQRARNLRRWLTEPGLIGKWQPFLIPHMQTPFLKMLKSKNPKWLAKDLVDRELATRASAPATR